VSSATESCGCGAKVTIDASADALIQALSEWRRTHLHETRPAPTHAVEENAPEHIPGGNNFAVTERIGESTKDRDHELNSRDRPSYLGRPISLRWHPND
jgi:hypothetical protein